MTDEPRAISSVDPPRFGLRGRDLPLIWILPLVLGALVALAVLPVVVIGYLGANDNTNRLLRERSELALNGVERLIRAHLDPVATQLVYLADAIADEAVDADDPRRLRDLALGALAATPQVTAIAFVRADGQAAWFQRRGHGGADKDWGALAAAARTLAGGEPWTGARWSAAIGGPQPGSAFIPVHVPVRQDGALQGVLAAAVGTSKLSAYLRDLAAGTRQTPFVLVGTDRVLAHPALSFGQPGAVPRPADGAVMHRIDGLGDDVLAGMWTRERNPFAGSAVFENAAGHWSWVGERSFGFVYRAVGDYGGVPWIVGMHYPGTDSRRERWIVLGIAIAGAALLALALATAALIGRRLARPVLDLAQAAGRVAALDFDAVAPGRRPRGPVRELNHAAAALERMAAGLRWFETYVPRALVRRLIAATSGGAGAALSSEAREVTIMFADLEGYTRSCADRPAAETSAYLNALLARVGPVIEDGGGTIDKYMGDGIMAFWGAPDARPDHAAAACAAALAVAQALEGFNAAQRSCGALACPMRIGLHTGTAIVGNVGFTGRVNYTVIGQAVNTAQRVEQLGRGQRGDLDAVILVSAATREAAGEAGFAFGALAEAGTAAELQAALPISRLGGAAG